MTTPADNLRINGDRLWESIHEMAKIDASHAITISAHTTLGTSPRFVYVAADAYGLPFHPGVFDGATMIRVVHHMSDVPLVPARKMCREAPT